MHRAAVRATRPRRRRAGCRRGRGRRRRGRSVTQTSAIRDDRHARPTGDRQGCWPYVRASAPPLDSPPPCASRPPSARPRSRRSPPAWRRRWSAAASSCPPPVVTATAATAPFALCVLVPRSRARDVGTCVLQMWAYLATYKMPNDDPEALERARHASPTRCAIDRFIGARHDADAAAPARARPPRRASAPGRRCSSGRTGSGSCSRTAPSPTCCCATRERFPRGAAQIYATFDLGLIGYWAVPTAPPVVRRAGRADGRRADARAAPHDGRVRRGVLGFRLGPAVRFPGRQSPGRHAVAALRHVRHGRPPAGRDRSRGRRGRAGPTPARSASRSSTWASTTSSTSPPGSRSPRGSGAARPP